jgi:hypothetical protein
MAKGKTLWEMLLEKFQGPVEMQFHNPLKAKIGSAVMIDDIDWRDYNFFVKEIREYKRTIGPKQFFFVDYVLLARPLGGADVSLRLRLNPVADPEKVSGLTHTVILLQLYDDLAYDEGLHKVVTDTTKKFQVLENDQVTEEYYRVHDVAGPYKAKVAVVQDADADAKAEKDEVERLQIEYWDYWRETQDAAGQPVTQYLVVEMDASSGWFQIWRGQEIDPRRVVVM